MVNGINPGPSPGTGFTPTPFFGLASPMWARLQGKPFVTVSPVGIATGADTVVPNAGADFGPDTPGTDTLGLQEAMNSFALTGGRIYLRQGIFAINSPVLWSSDQALFLAGETSGNAQSPGDNTPIATTIMPGPSFPSSSYLLDFENVSTNDGAVTMCDLTLFGSQVIGSGASQYASGFRSGASGAGGPARQVYTNLAVKYCFNGCVLSNQGGPTMMDKVHFSVCSNHGLYSSVTHLHAGLIECYQSDVTAGVSGTASIGELFMDSPPSVAIALNNFVQIDKVYLSAVNNGVCQVAFDLAGAGYVNVGNVVFDSLPSASSPLFIRLNASNAKTFASFNSVTGRLTGNFSGSIVGPVTGLTGMTGRLKLSNWNVDLNGYTIGTWFNVPSSLGFNLEAVYPYQPQGFALTTPSIPTSGTAQVNTFPFPVRIYITGAGTTTAYTITAPAGNAETFSLALSLGQEITLDPGASITISYTTAPTWKWYGV